MKVLNFIQLKNYNGTCSFAIDVAKELQNKHDVICIVNKNNNQLIEKIKNEKLEYYCFSSNKFLSLLQYIYICFKNRKNSIAIMHDLQRFPLIITKFFGIKNYTSIFGEGERKLHKFTRYIDYIFVSKQYQKNIINKAYKNIKIDYLPYTTTFHDKNVNKNKQDIFTFGALGSLVKLKGFEQLIKASKILKDKGYKFQVLIGGDGLEKQNLENLIKDNQLQDYCKLLGLVKDKDNFYNKLDVYCFTSYKEDIGMIVPEAISYKVPIIGNRIGFTSDLLDENDYLIIESENLKNVDKIWPKSPYVDSWWEIDTNYRFETEPLNENLLAEKMEFAMNNYDVMKNKAENAYNKINNNYSLEKCIDKIFKDKL